MLGDGGGFFGQSPGAPLLEVVEGLLAGGDDGELWLVEVGIVAGGQVDLGIGAGALVELEAFAQGGFLEGQGAFEVGDDVPDLGHGKPRV